MNENIDTIKQRRNIQVDSMGRIVADDAQDQESTAETTPIATTKMFLTAKTKVATSKKSAKKSKTTSATKAKKVAKDKAGKHSKKSK